jgi:hypothetical protein
VTRRDTIVILDYFGSWELCLPFMQTEVSMSGYIGFDGTVYNRKDLKMTALSRNM